MKPLVVVMKPLTMVMKSFIMAAVIMGAARWGLAQSYDARLYSGLRWRMIGPFRGGRVNAVSGVPGQPNTFYFGSVGGGVWKSTNAGRTWTPIFDSQPIASIGAIGVSPSRPSVVYVGTGEADMRSQISFGNGMYKSTDAGRTWRRIGLDDTRQIGRVLVDPRDPDVVFVAALGHAYGANPDRGVFRSRDGGSTWQKILFRGDSVGAIDLAFDARDPRIIYAAMWNTRRPPWSIYPPSYGPGGGLFKSTDGGDTWAQLAGGLPADGLGRIGIAVATANPGRVYAIVDAREGGLFRSDDAGVNWLRVSSDNRIWGRGWYFCHVVADPQNGDVVYVSNTSVYRSTDAGRSWTAIKGAPGGDDYHQLWIAPDDPARMILASDQGAIVSVDGTAPIPTWSSWYNQPTAQLYHVSADTRFPYWVTGAQQDSGAIGTPTRSGHAEISMHEWTDVCAGGEAGYTAADPLHPTILFGGTVTRCNLMTGESKNVSPEQVLSEPPRHTWTLPLVFSPADPHALYFSDQFLFKTTDGGDHWTRISPDLSREDPGVPANLDAATAADAPQTKRRGVIYTIAPSPVRAPLIWVGTDDGLIHVTEDDGKTWRNVTPRELAAWSKVAMVEASHVDPQEAYAAIDRHRLEDNDPYVYRTRDGGRTWQAIVNGLPRGVYLQTVKEDTKRKGLLFAGTELGVFVSFDDGDLWQPLQLNLPPTSMRDLAVHEDDLVVATHGRGFWVLDSGLGMLRQMTDEVARADAWLFRPSDVIAAPPGTENGTPLPRDEPFAENPPYGALIDYYLATAPAGPVTLEILDAAGALVRRFSSTDRYPPVNPDALNIPAFWVRPPEVLSAEPGMHRWVWDLHRAQEGATETAGAGSGVSAGAATGGRGVGRGARGGGGGRGRGAAGAAGVVGGGRGEAPRASPGVYSVRLTVNGRSYMQPLNVRPDPRLNHRPPPPARLRRPAQSVGRGIPRVGFNGETRGRDRSVAPPTSA